MNKLIIPGVASLSENGQLHFESGCPSDSHIVSGTVRRRGTLEVHPDASVDFQPERPHICLPPQVDIIARGEGYHVKRTTRNYIIQVKMPIVESRRETEKKICGMLPEIIGSITLDRREILQ